MILLIHPRRGLFQLTNCRNCGYVFDCENCTNKLTTYQKHKYELELVCSQCQSYYKYPKKCPKCGSDKIGSSFSGIDDLTSYIKQKHNKEVVRLDEAGIFEKQNQHFIKKNSAKIFVTTRLFDPGIDYTYFQKVIFIQAQNLLASSDYLVSEEVFKSLSELFINLNYKAEVVFDTSNPELSFFTDFLKLNNIDTKKQILNWYFSFLHQENFKRKKFLYPPHENLLLFTTQEKNLQKSLQKISSIREIILKEKKYFPEILVGNYYPARFLKRKNMYSHHLLIRFQKQYPKFKSFKKYIKDIQETYQVQIRMNPRHLF